MSNYAITKYIGTERIELIKDVRKKQSEENQESGKVHGTSVRGKEEIFEELFKKTGLEKQNRTLNQKWIKKRN